MEIFFIRILFSQNTLRSLLRLPWHLFLPSFFLVHFPLFFSQFFPHICCERWSTRRVLQKQIRRKLNGFVVFDSAHRTTYHAAPWPRWEWETRRNKRRSKWERKKHAKRGEKLILSFSFPVQCFFFFLSLFLVVCVCVREKLFCLIHCLCVWLLRSALFSTLYPTLFFCIISTCILSLSHFSFLFFFFYLLLWILRLSTRLGAIFYFFAPPEPSSDRLRLFFNTVSSICLSLSPSLSLSHTSALVSQVAGEWTRVQSQIAKGEIGMGGVEGVWDGTEKLKASGWHISFICEIIYRNGQC